MMSLRSLPRPLSSTRILMMAAVTIGATGCDTMNSLVRQDATINPVASQLPATQLSALVPPGKLNTASRQLAAEGLKAMDAKDYRKASEIFNLAVKTDMTNSYLHFLNGVAYQMRGITGESALFPLAEQGYQTAVRFDNSNWLARYYAGLLAMYQRNWGDAQNKLAEAALYAGKQPDLLYDLAVASYYNRDPKTAAAALAGLRELQGGKTEDPRVLRASAIVAAALDQREEADNFLDRLRQMTQAKEDLVLAEQRVEAWRSAHRQGGLMKTQFPAGGGGFPAAGGGGGFPQAPAAGGFDPAQQGGQMGQQGGGFAGAAQGAGGGFGNSFVNNQMAAVDVVILSTEEDSTNKMGVNLLDGLRIQFGNPALQTAAYSRTVTQNFDNVNNPGGNTGTTAITRAITVPAVTYTLNIANAATKRNEVLARPTLVALANQTSNFFSGVDVNAAAVSNGQGSAIQIQKEVGVKLSVTPEFLPDNQIKLNVAAERTFLALPAASVVFDYRLDTSKTTVNANVVMKFGETLILSGLSERDKSRDRGGVPVLQDIPLVQYLFSTNTDRDYYKSVLILLTPRKAQYTNRSDADVAADSAQASPEDLALMEFEAKYKPWFKPIPNLGEITKQLDRSTLYREFRTGDLGGSWQNIADHEGRLNAAVSFLFY